MAAMSFASPGRLWLLLALVPLLAGWLIFQWQRRRYARRFASPEMVAAVAPDRPGRGRQGLAAALVVGLVGAVLGFARPTVKHEVPRETATIMLAIDVSDSMAATDVQPSRLIAAERAARRFAHDLPSRFKLGLIAFGPGATTLVSPTTDHTLVENRVTHLQLSPGTAMGEAIFAALAAIRAAQPAAATGTRPPAARIVVLSDGATNSGRSDAVAAAAAAKARVPVSTIAYGTDDATVQSQGQTVSVPVDRNALRRIADTTGGTFFEAATAAQLRSVYDRIGADIDVVVRRRDISAWFSGLALTALLVAAFAALLARPRAVAF